MTAAQFCSRCEEKNAQIVDLQHLLREAQHVEKNLLQVIGLLYQRLEKKGAL